jgi:hypothetical protein
MERALAELDSASALFERTSIRGQRVNPTTPVKKIAMNHQFAYQTAYCGGSKISIGTIRIACKGAENLRRGEAQDGLT